VETEVDPALLPLKMPIFTLQPLIENAIKHGVSGLLGQGVVRLSARQTGGGVVIDVEDNAGAFCEEAGRDGLGMAMVDKRIKNLCGRRYGLAVTCTPQELTRVTVTLPAEGVVP
jgi:two-component system LytT family sensor kinase